MNRLAEPSRSVRSDAEQCAAIVREHARTFSAASRFLPSHKQRAAYAIYAFCRVADDIVDECAGAEEEASSALDGHRAMLISALRGEARTPLFRELAWAIRRFHIPATPFHELITMLHRDLSPMDVRTWCELSQYCTGVASTVGEMCAHVFGMPADSTVRADALAHARTLGVALQLTNILRDVGEDAARGRCYLPADDLQAFGVERSEILSRTIDPRDGRWRALMQHEIARARALYAQSAPGLELIDRDARCCANICAWGYAAILDAIERREYDSLNGRAHIGTTRKALIALSAWRSSRGGAAAPATSARAGSERQHARA